VQDRYAWLLVALVGCAAQDGSSTIANTFDPCHPPSIVPDAGATQEQLAGIAAAEVLWQTHGAPELGSGTTGTLEIHFETAAPLFHGVYDDQAAVIYINSDLTDTTTLSIVIAHEIGHAFGLVHVPSDVRASLMNPGNLTVKPTDDDRRTLEARWGVCASGS
jgi:hypothetical protein